MKIRKIKNTAEKLKNGGRTRQTDNRGLTLIELVITVAIIAIFSGVVMTFIMTGSNTIELFCRSVRQTKKIFAGNIKYFGQCDNFVVGNETVQEEHLKRVPVF